MTMAATLILVFGWFHFPRRWAYVVAAFGALLFHPLIGTAGIAMAVATRARFVVTAKRAAANAYRADVLLALDLVSLGATAGLAFDAAVLLAVDEISGPLADDLKTAVTRRQAGLVDALDERSLSRAFDAARRSAVSGARLGNTLVALAHEIHEDEAAAERERIERLPVKLLFPLAFLILPGFVLVAVVPAIVSGIGELGF